MSGVSVTTLRQHLQEYLARVARGEHIQVTSRGRVTAESATVAGVTAQSGLSQVPFALR